MKNIGVYLTALILAGSTQAFAITPGATAGVTLALTLSLETPGYRVVDPETKEISYEFERTSSKVKIGAEGDEETLSETRETKTVITAVRVGNAELLGALNENDELDGSIKGWSIIALTSAAGEEGISFFAVKKGQSPVALDMSLEPIGAVEAASSKSVQDFVRETSSYSKSSSAKIVAVLSIYDIALQGFGSAGYKYASGVLGRGEAAAEYEFETFFSAISISSLSGTSSSEEEGDSGDVVNGSISISASKVVDLEPLGFGSMDSGPGVETIGMGVEPN